MIETQPLRSTEVLLRQVVLESARLESTPEFRNRPTLTFPEVKFGHSCYFTVPKSGQILVRLDLSLDALDKTDSEIGLHAEYQLAFEFKVPIWAKYLKRNNITGLERASKMLLASISFSTARGILYERAQGTYFAKFLLPIINPSELIGLESDNGE